MTGLTRAALRRLLEQHAREVLDELPRKLAREMPPEHRFRVERIARLEFERRLQEIVESALAELDSSGSSDPRGADHEVRS